MSWLRSFLVWLPLAVVLAATTCCFAASQPALLQSELRQPDKIWVGQRLDLNVTLFTTSSFAGVPRFDLPKDAGLAIIVDDAHPLLGAKTIDGVSYMSKQYDISLFPLRSGTLTLPAFQVEFGYQGDAGQEADASLSTTAARITVLDVPGADPQLPLVTATDLEVDDRWQPALDKVAVGDAFTRTISMRATGLPGMALPPLRMEASDGLAVYARQPQVSTDTQRGEYVGKRVETFSLVCQKVGTHTLPEMRIQWWNPTDEILREVRLRPVTLQVMPNPLLEPQTSAGTAASPGMSSAWRWTGGGLLFMGAAALSLVLLRKARKRVAQANEATEQELFQQFERAAASNAAEETMRALTRWFDAVGRQADCGSLSLFIAKCGEPMLQSQFSALEASIYSKRSEPWSGMLLARQLDAAREKYLRRRGSVLSRQGLGPLNP